jgi:hypothetical protein
MSVMKIARRVASGILMMAVVAVSRAIGGAGTTPLDRVPPTIWETQMTVRKGHIVQFQATVINKRDRTLTLLTAAHCLAPADMGHAIEMVRGGESLVGRIAAVWQNPSYHPVRSRDPRDPSVRDIVGVDNAIVTVAVEPGSEAKERFFRQIKTAAMAERAAPVGARQIFLVHVIDQCGQEHVVRAGNHLNAKCLAWGHASYRVKPGDSGAGVFVLRTTPQGQALPILIGNVSLTDDRGGIAPLVDRRDRWVAEAFTGQKPQEGTP